jgi:hypothetical protein
LLWFGHEIEAPACPDNAAGVGYEGNADPAGPLPCGACSCTPQTATCGLTASIGANAAPCDAGADAAPATPFGGPAGWDGGCTPYDAVDGGVASLTIAPLTLDESGCTPVRAPPGESPGLWSTFARACALNACPSTGETCAPTASSGFRRCIFFLAGDQDCPGVSLSPYTEKHVFFAGADDTRGCSSCACTSAPGVCSSVLSVYADDACSDKPIDIPLTSATALCSNVSNSTLGSKSIRPAIYAPGTCQPSGGAPIGMVVPLMPSTFCCLPSP